MESTILKTLREIEGILALRKRVTDSMPRRFTLPQLTVIRILAQNGPTRVCEIARLAGCAPSTVSGILDRLERDGIILRQFDEADRRAICVDLSEEAKRKGDELKTKAADEYFSKATGDELELILSGLTTFRDILRR